MITSNDIKKLCISASNAGLWNVGVKNHVPVKLPPDKAAIYVFKWNDTYLKVGKVNSKSNARYQSQHYNPNSSNSNLSKSLLSDTEFRALVGDNAVGEWIKKNTVRFNILIPTNLEKNFVHFAEAFFILKCNPRFENTRV